MAWLPSSSWSQKAVYIIWFKVCLKNVIFIAPELSVEFPLEMAKYFHFSYVGRSRGPTHPFQKFSLRAHFLADRLSTIMFRHKEKLLILGSGHVSEGVHARADMQRLSYDSWSKFIPQIKLLSNFSRMHELQNFNFSHWGTKELMFLLQSHFSHFLCVNLCIMSSYLGKPYCSPRHSGCSGPRDDYSKQIFIQKIVSI